MNTDFEPMLAAFGLGIGELMLLLVALGVMILPTAAVVVIVYLVLNRNRSTPPQPLAASPLAPVSPAPPTTKTQVMPRKCPQCGAALPADAPEGLCPACLLQRGFATEGGGGAAGQASFVPPGLDELGKLFPQLEILECLGRGGMGAVYKARQPRLDRVVALKILAPEKQNDPQFAERFEREARVLARLNHPNIVSVFDFGEVQGRFYLIMEYVDGLTLRQVMQTEKISPAQALELVPKICDALQYAHGQGIVHRDIKPENILLDQQGHLKIADFGIAKIAGVDVKGMSLTGARDVMGTPNYMAPEQVETPQTVDHRADIYSLGVVFYEMLTGELPLGKFQPPSKKVQVDVRLDEVVLHALEKEPARRYQQANQVKTAVETIASSPPPIGPAPMAAAAGLAGGAVSMNDPSDKIILPAFLLAFFFGPFGAHRFYVGKYGTAVLQLFTCGGLGVWATIDWILLACRVFTDADGRPLKNWIHAGPSLPRPLAPRGVAVATGPDHFWRNFAIVAGCLFLMLILMGMLAFAGLAKLAAHSGASVKAMAGPPQFDGAALQYDNGEYRTNFTQTFLLDADGEFKIDNINGSTEVHGWNSNVVELATSVHGKTPESVENMRITVNHTPDHAHVHTDTRSSANGFHSFWNALQNGFQENATVDYVVHVPQGVRLPDVSSVNGDVVIDGVAGDITASTVNGETRIKDAHRNLKLSTVNGSITAEMNVLGNGQKVSLDAVNGQMELTMPEDADATFAVTTVNGNISSEFPALHANHEWPVGNNLHGTLGNGAGNVKVDAVNGTIRFLKGGPTQPAATDTNAEAGVTNTIK